MKILSIYDSHVGTLLTENYRQRVVSLANGLMLSSQDERLLFQIEGDSKWWDIYHLTQHDNILSIRLADAEPLSVNNFSKRLEPKS